MGRRLAAVVATCLVVAVAAAVAQAEFSQEGNLRISFHGSFSPVALPRDKPAPISVDVEGAIGTTDGSHPPAVQRVVLDLNRNGHVDTTGLPSCNAGTLQSATSEEALARCRPALVGRGSFGATVEFGATTRFPASGTALVFNGTAHGKPAFIIQLYGTTPVSTSLVIPLTIAHPKTGRYGTTLSARIPALANGSGSVTRISLHIGRSFGYRGQRHSLISAACAAPAGFSAAIFTFARGDFHFADGRTVHIALTRHCTVRG
jgi:hypothetical protein